MSFPALALLLASCAPPPEVPDTEDQPDLSEICRDLYAHHPDEDPALLHEQLAWLYAWLEVWEADTRDGYRVDPLTDEVVDALDGEDRATAGMLGVVVGSSSAHGVADATWAMVAVNQEEVHPGTVEDYQRAYLTDLDCFLDRSCDRLALTEDYTANLPFFVTSTNHTMNQYLWLEGEQGTAMIHRAWLPTPPVVNVSWLAVAEQFYLDAFLPWGEGHYRVQTTWLVNTQEDFGEDAVMNMVISGMQQHSEDLEAWLDAQGS
ncbi:MAG: hypothetical protein ABIO70_31300 [Pseudomonadota bacterium]